MCQIHHLSTDEKLALRDQLNHYASCVGGKNAFLKIIETIKKTSPHPLLSKTTNLRFAKGIIRWNKSIHRDTLSLLSSRLNARYEDNNNLLLPTEAKEYKKVSNMIRTLAPLSFTVEMNNPGDGAGFSFKGFEIIDDTTTFIDPTFELLFFCPINSVKKLLNFSDKSTPVEENDED